MIQLVPLENDPTHWLFLVAGAVFGIALLASVWRLVVGPSLPDRVVAVDLIGFLAVGIICVFAGALLVAAAVELPAVGDPNAPAHVHVAPRYLAESDSFLHIPNVVTTVLASYRGFDTLGETVVVFTAGLGVLVLLSGFTRTRRAAQDRAGVKEDSDA